MKNSNKEEKIYEGSSEYMYIDGGRIYISEYNKEAFYGSDIVAKVSLEISDREEAYCYQNTNLHLQGFQHKDGRIYLDIVEEGNMDEGYKTLRKLTYEEMKQLLIELKLECFIKEFFDPVEEAEKAYVVDKMAPEEYIQRLKDEYLNQSVGLSKLDDCICKNLRTKCIDNYVQGTMFTHNMEYYYQWDDSISIKIVLDLIDGEFGEDIEVLVKGIELTRS